MAYQLIHSDGGLVHGGIIYTLRRDYMDELVKKSDELKQMIERKRKEIDNPVLTTGMLAELEFFIENLRDEE